MSSYMEKFEKVKKDIRAKLKGRKGYQSIGTCGALKGKPYIRIQVDNLENFKDIPEEVDGVTIVLQQWTHSDIRALKK